MRPAGQTMAKPVAAVPFDKDPAHAAVVPIPPLSLEQYASLCVDLARFRRRRAEVIRRYGVPNEAAHRALDQHWSERFAHEPEVFDAFRKGVELYSDWVKRVAR